MSSFVLKTQANIGIESNNGSLKDLHRFLVTYDFSMLRSALKSVDVGVIYKDNMRGNHRFNLGFTERNIPKSRFGSDVMDKELGVVCPRVCQTLVDGKSQVSVALDGIVRLIAKCFKVFEKNEFVIALRKKVGCLKFPLLVGGSDVFKHVSWEWEDYDIALSLMSRVSIVLHERDVSDVGTMFNMETTFGRKITNKKIELLAKLFGSIDSTFFHTDKNDVDGIQIVIVVAYKMPEECFVCIDDELDANVAYVDYEEDENLKLHVFGCNFLKSPHGNIRLFDDYAKRCCKDSWMIRITPYATQHIEKWTKLLELKTSSERFCLMDKFYMCESRVNP